MKKSTNIKDIIKDVFILEMSSFEDYDIKDLVKLALDAKDAYYNSDKPILSDEQYDALERYIKLASPDDDVTDVVGSQVRGEAVKLLAPMAGLDQLYEGDVERWITKHKLQTINIVLTDKLDGNSIQLGYNKSGAFAIALTRGDGYEGADCTRHLQHVPNFPKKGDPNMLVRAEVIVRKEDFENAKAGFKKTYKNLRNMVAGVLNATSSDPAGLKFFRVVAYEIMGSKLSKVEQLKKLKELGFEVANYWYTAGGELDDKQLSMALEKSKKNSPYELDGIVLDVNDPKLRSTILPSRDTLEPEYAKKFKINDASNSAVGEVVDVEFNVSKTGYLKPRVQIKPVDLVGVTIQHATGFNAKFIKDGQIGPGAKIHITRSGEVIPFITHVIEPMKEGFDKWFEEKLNAQGEWEWTENAVDVFLTSDHPEIAIQKAIHFFNTLEVDMLREGNIRKLFEAGYDTPTKIILLAPSMMTRVLGENGNKAHKSLHEKLENVRLPSLMDASGVFGRGVGTRKLNKLWEHSQGDETIFMDVQRILEVEGFEQKTALKVVNGYPKFQDFLKGIKHAIRFAKYEAPSTDGPLAGEVFVFTGFRDKDLQKQIAERGGHVADTYSGKVTCVVARNPNETSTKLTKARKDGKRVISIEQLRDML